MELAVRDNALAERRPETACAHCGLPVGARPVGDGPFFCCTGCALVYDSLQHAGFGDTFYELRDVAPGYGRSRPARVEVDALQLSEMDTPAFLEEHTRAFSDGIREVDLFLDGVHCAACVWLVERLPFEMPGISYARLDLPRARLTVHFDPEAVRLSEAAQWLARFGYTVYPSRQRDLTHRTTAERRLLLKMGVCWALAGNVMLFAFALYAGLDGTTDTSLEAGAKWASLALAMISVSYGGSEFFRKAWMSIKMAWRAKMYGRLHMDTPIALGILVGFGHSAWATISGRGEVWFDSITVLIAALLTARWLQLRSRRLAGDASDRVLALIPSMARRARVAEASEGALDEKTSYEMVRVDTLQAGDVIQVPAGEVAPVDGVVVYGASTVNNAVLTGESKPEQLAVGDRIEAGATNIQAPVWVRVSASGEATRVGRLLAWIRNQEEKQAPVVLLADRLSGVFVAVLLGVAALTALAWGMVSPGEIVPHVVALLVISCPCALGMATPLAMAVASGRAARQGIFVKSDEAMQQLTKVDAVALDKTGTLTEGRMTVVAFSGDESVLHLAAVLEGQSNHPIAQALVEAFGDCRLDGEPRESPDAFEVVAGSGVRGRVDGRSLAVGRPDWVETQAAPNASLQPVIVEYAGSGHTPVAVAADGHVRAVLGIGDRLREDAKAMVDFMHTRGTAVYMVSGDHPAVVRAVARTLNIPEDRAHGHVLPEEKKAFVRALQQEDHRIVAMVGDGVNDAEALHAADIGIAVRGGSSPSLVAADVFLTRGGLTPVAEAMTGAGRVMRVIRKNLGISLAYNLIGAGAAVFGFVTPLVAAIAMPISSLIVVGASVAQNTFSNEA